MAPTRGPVHFQASNQREMSYAELRTSTSFDLHQGMQLKLDSIPSAMCGIGKMDARSKCILLAASWENCWGWSFDSLAE